LGEKVTGVEARISELVKLNATMNNTANTNLGARLEGVNSEIAGIKAQMTNIVNLHSNVEAQLSAIAQIKFQLGKMTADLAGQAGVNNSIEKRIEDLKQTFVSSAGRDVNMLPKQAVDIITESWKFFGIVIGILLIAATTIISLSYKYARQRAEKRFEIEKKTKDNIYKLLHGVLVEVPPDKATNIRNRLGEVDG
jgi:archaellum component FlaC